MYTLRLIFLSPQSKLKRPCFRVFLEVWYSSFLWMRKHFNMLFQIKHFCNKPGNRQRGGINSNHRGASPKWGVKSLWKCDSSQNLIFIAKYFWVPNLNWNDQIWRNLSCRHEAFNKGKCYFEHLVQEVSSTKPRSINWKRRYRLQGQYSNLGSSSLGWDGDETAPAAKKH